MREQSCSIPRGLKVNKNSAEGEVFFVDFPSYRTLQAQRDSMDSISMSRLCKSQAAVGGAIDEISSRLIVFDYRNTQPRVRQ